MCGCGNGNTCYFCNSNYFIGYDQQMTNYALFSLPGSNGAPNSTGQTCSLSTEDIDVKIKICLRLVD